MKLFSCSGCEKDNLSQRIRIKHVINNLRVHIHCGIISRDVKGMVHQMIYVKSALDRRERFMESI